MQNESELLLLNNSVAEYENTFATDGNVLYCRICNVILNPRERLTITRHLLTGNHQNTVSRQSPEEIQASIPYARRVSTPFQELFAFLVKSDIPLSKLNKKSFRKFLKKYTNESVPDESTLRGYCLTEMYDQTVNVIRNYVLGKKLWVSITETIDFDEHWCIANVVVGTLEVDTPGKTFLLTTEILEETNHQSICKLFNEALAVLWPNGLQREDVFLFFTNTAPYMVEAGKALATEYTKMIHVTCFYSVLNRVTERICNNFPKVVELISNANQIFLESPSLELVFKSVAPGMPLPLPQPIIARWVTWLEAAFYYFENYNDFCRAVKTFDKNDALSVEALQTAIEDPDLANQLYFIKANYNFLPSTIAALENNNYMCLADSLKLLKNVEKKLFKVNGNIGHSIHYNFLTTANINKSYEALKIISGFIDGSNNFSQNYERNFYKNDIILFKYTFLSVAHIEKTLLKNKNLFTDSYGNYVIENLKMPFVMQLVADFFGKMFDFVHLDTLLVLTISKICFRLNQIFRFDSNKVKNTVRRNNKDGNFSI